MRIGAEFVAEARANAAAGLVGQFDDAGMDAGSLWNEGCGQFHVPVGLIHQNGRLMAGKLLELQGDRAKLLADIQRQGGVCGWNRQTAEGDEFVGRESGEPREFSAQFSSGLRTPEGAVEGKYKEVSHA